MWQVTHTHNVSRDHMPLFNGDNERRGADCCLTRAAAIVVFAIQEVTTRPRRSGPQVSPSPWKRNEVEEKT